MIASAKEYHVHTSYDRQKMTPHYLDWANQPSFYKDYPGIDPILLSRDVRFPEGKLSSLLKDTASRDRVRSLNLENLSVTLRLAYSLTAKGHHPGSDFYYRSVASAGALYPTEIYLAAHGIHGLDNGLYHFAIHHHGLALLRAEDLIAYPDEMTRTSVVQASIASFFLTAIFFRSAWKYRERAYRYHLLDTGHVVENLILALKALKLPVNLSHDFDDEKVNRLLGIDETREAALAVVHALGHVSVPDETEPVREIKELPEAFQKASRVSPREIPYRTVREIHSAGSSVVSRKHPESEMIRELGVSPETWTSITTPSAWPEVMGHSEAFMMRRSRRNFVEVPLHRDILMSLLDSLCAKDSGDPNGESVYERSICTGFITGHVEDMRPGFYLLDRVNESMGLVAPGILMEKVARICLDQAWLGHAAVHFLFLANLDLLDRTWGARGYRYAMMHAGRMGERLYIAATAMGIGCCGIGAFYDGEAAALLGLKDGAKLLYLVGLGPVKSIKDAPSNG
jgi:SagB-type dehydrogenase family enzyme